MATRELIEYAIAVKGNLEAAAKKGDAALDGLGEKARVATNKVGELSAGILVAGTAFVALASDVAESTLKLDRQAKMFDLSAESLKALEFGAQRVGLELDDVIPEDLAERMFDAATSGGEMADIFRRWGIELVDVNGALRSADDILPIVIERLTETEDATSAAALASILLGDNGRKMLAAFDDRAAFDAFKEGAAEFGTRTGPEAVAQAKAWNEATGQLSLAFEELKVAVVDEFGDEATLALKNVALGLIFVSAMVENAKKNLLAHDIRDVWADIGEQFDKATAKAEKFWRTAQGNGAFKPAFDFQGGGESSSSANFIPGSFNAAQLVRDAPAASTSAGGEKAVKDARKVVEVLGEITTIEIPLNDAKAAVINFANGAERAIVNIDDSVKRATGFQLDAGALNALGAGATGGLGGILASSAAGPGGAAVGIVSGLVNSDGGIAGAALSLEGEVLSLLEGLPDALGALFSSEFLAPAIAGFAEVGARTVVTLLPEIGLAVTLGITDSLINLPQMLVDEFADALKRLINPFGEKLEGIGENLSGFFGQQGGHLGTQLGAKSAGNRRLLGIGLPFLDGGSDKITRTGLAVIHEGEMVVPPRQAEAMRSGGGMGRSVSLGGIAISTPSIRGLTESIQRQTGSLGLNLSTSELAF